MAIPTTGLIGRWFGPGATYASNGFVQDLSGAAIVDTGSAVGAWAVPGAHLSGKANATLSFTFQSTDNEAVVFSHGVAQQPYLFVVDASNSTAIFTGSGSPSITIDGAPFSGTTRVQLRAAICDGSTHDIVISGINFTATTQWVNNGIYVGGFNSGNFQFSGTVANLTLDGVPYGANHGTLQGGDTLSTLHVGAGNGPGGNLANHGVHLDGSADYVSFTPQVFSGDYTVCYWLKRDLTNRIDGVGGNSSGSSIAGYFPANSTQTLLRGADSGSSALFNHGVDTTQWHHFVTGRSGLAVFLYVDGQDLSISHSSASANCTFNQWGRYSTSPYMDGSIADALIYNRALSPSEIAQVYAEGAQIEDLNVTGPAAVQATGPAASLRVARQLIQTAPAAVTASGLAASLEYSGPQVIHSEAVRIVYPPSNTRVVTPPSNTLVVTPP